MKLFTVVFMFITNCCFAQQWQVEVGGGIAGYSGDLSKPVDFKTVGPSLTANIKYQFPNNFILVRGGLSFGKIHANDADGKNAVRNLSFKSSYCHTK